MSVKTLYVTVIGDLLARRDNHGLHIDLTLLGYHQLLLGLPEEPINEMNHMKLQHEKIFPIISSNS